MPESISSAFRAWLLHPVTTLIKELIMDMAQLTQALTDAGTAVGDIGSQLTKSLGEIEQDIADLKAGASNTTPEADAALAALLSKISAAKAVAQQLDDIVPDPAAPPAGGDSSGTRTDTP